MGAVDWAIIFVYIAVLIGLSWRWGRGQANPTDYYVGGRQLPWLAVAISTMATQTSAISFISIPAYVALKPGGGLTWLQYEFGVPLAMILVIAVLIPFFRRLKLVTVYEYLELRFGPPVRTLLSAVFLLSRGLSTGVAVYAAALVLSVCLDKPIGFTILLMGVATVIYDTLGGMKAVVYSDVIQMLVLVTGLMLCIVFAVQDLGGVSSVLTTFPAERLRTIEWASGIGDSATTPFWAFLLGGIFLYASYYGVDQSQAQRELSAPSVEECKRSLLFNGMARFPLTLLYLGLGIAVGAVYLHFPEFRAEVPADHPDYLIPEFILYRLPVGVKGILIAALLAAAMSSLDSALNSLSAVTLRDFIEKKWHLSEKQLLRLGKLTTVAWGGLITFFAFYVGQISETVIEAINKIGSAFYGPILAAFLAGILIERISLRGVIIGILAGVGLNLSLWLSNAPIHWMWWNLFGCVMSLAAAYLASLFWPQITPVNRDYLLTGRRLKAAWSDSAKLYWLLLAYFGVMVLVGVGIMDMAMVR